MDIEQVSLDGGRPAAAGPLPGEAGGLLESLLHNQDMAAASRPLTQPNEDRLSPDHPHYSEIIQRHASAMERGEAGYIDPLSGLFVITAATHLRRGNCCSNGCRHCPYV